MLKRELSKGKGKTAKLWRIELDDQGQLVREEESSGRGTASYTRGSRADFTKYLKEQKRRGYTETERSLSRRSLKKDTKFWAIELDDVSFTVNYGKLPYQHLRGTKQTKDFDTPEEALAAYLKAVAEKLRDGYVDADPRRTRYTDMVEQLPPPQPRARPKKVDPDKKKTVARPAPPLPPVHTEVAHRIDLAPQDWFWAGWRPWTPLLLPEPAVFDKEACLARAAPLRKYHGEETTTRLAIPLSMTRPEAQFWFEMLTHGDYRDASPRAVAEKLAKRKFDGSLGREEITKKLKRWQGYQGDLPPVLRCLVALLPLEEVLEVFLEFQSTGYWSGGTPSFQAGYFTGAVLVYCTENELKRFRKIVQSRLDLNIRPRPSNPYYPLTFHLAARLRCHEEMRRIVGSWPDDIYSKGWANGTYPEETFLFGLGSPELVEAEVRRLKMPFRYSAPELLRALLATTELRALDVARDALLGITNRAVCEAMLKVFALVKAPEAAEHMVELSRSSKAPAVARAWLDQEVGNAIAGLIPVAAGKNKLAALALQYLREKKRDGHANLIRSCLTGVSADVADVICRQVFEQQETTYPTIMRDSLPDWLRRGLESVAGLTPMAGAEFVQPFRLPPVVIEQWQLAPEQVGGVLLALQHSDWGAAQPLIVDLKAKADRVSLAEFAWGLFEQWLGEGGPFKHKWAMKALGLLGSDATALKLAPLIRAWPGESQHARAVLGLECLRSIGTEAALMQLSGIAQKVKFKALQEKARECLEAIATDRGLSQEQLEDRIVPHCDLDERGGLFDFGPRKFRLVLAPGMKPMVKDESGAVRPDLPKPGAKDDPTLADQAIKDWQLLKKQVGEVAKVQAIRLEQAMVTGRRWSVADFEALLVRHPLMTNLVRLLLWGGYDSRGGLARTFRVTEDQTYADARDNSCTLEGVASVGIVHPLELDDDLKRAWGEVFGDYEILPPFPQLGRSVYALNEAERKGEEITRFGDVQFPVATLAFGLEKLGWVRGAPQDNGIVHAHSKPFPSASMTAVVGYKPGFPVGYREGWEDLEITECYFLKGIERVANASWRRDKGQLLPLSKVDPIVLSEVLSDLSTLATKGK